MKHGATWCLLVVSTQLLMGSWRDMALKILVFYQVIFEAAQFASQHIDLVQSMVMLTGWGQAAPFTGITLQPFMLGATVNPWTCPLLPENTNHLRVRISALQQKSTQEKPHCNNVNVLKSLLGGNNAYLMVTTICIYINWNECFSHNCSLC